MLVFIITMAGLVRKTELRVVSLEVITRNNASAISSLTDAVSDLTRNQANQHDWIITHDAASKAVR
jgi:hypothetical protein